MSEWRDNRRFRQVTSTTLPESIPPVLLTVWFFDFLEDPDELRLEKGYGLHDLVNTIGRLRRVSREFRRAVDSAFAQWKTRLGIGQDGFYLDSPCATLYDLRASAFRSCFVCAASLDGRLGTHRACERRGIVQRVDETDAVRDAVVLCCSRCEQRFFTTPDSRVMTAFSGADRSTRFFTNTNLPRTPMERFSGVLAQIVPKLNPRFRAEAKRLRMEAARNAIEYRMVRHAKKRDVAATIARTFGVRCKKYQKAHNFEYDVCMHVTDRGEIQDRFLKRAAAMSVLSRGFLTLCPRTGVFGQTWQADMLADEFMSETHNYDRIQWRHRLLLLGQVGRRSVDCTVEGVRFFLKRRHGVEVLYKRCFDTMAVGLRLVSRPLEFTRYVQNVSLEVVVNGDFLHDHFSEDGGAGGVVGSALRSADVDTEVLASEYSHLRDDEKASFQVAVRRNVRIHEERVLKGMHAALRRRGMSSMRLASFSQALDYSIGRDFTLLLRIANPHDPALPKRKMTMNGITSYYQELGGLATYRV